MKGSFNAVSEHFHGVFCFEGYISSLRGENKYNRFVLWKTPRLESHICKNTDP
jgi:hypothetical protein